MSLRLHALSIANFKAFREFNLKLEGRHLLVYGINGAGKSSLYWALYTFLQSARKPPVGVAKYFDPENPENLLNIHEQQEASPRPGEIALTLRDTVTHTDTTRRISQADHGTHQQPAILKGDLASDFITYRFFFGFSHFRNSQSFDLWPLFEKEILPFCVSTTGTGQTPQEMWQQIRSGDPNPSGSRGLGGASAYETFRHKADAFAQVLTGIVDSISNEAQQFYDTHFANDDPAPFELRLGVTRAPSATGSNQGDFHFRHPEIGFEIRVGGQPVTRPQSFLNEAKLTQLALSVRFAASLVNLHESDLKLLVLDDLLVSLDMSNRMRVVDILLSATFAGYQKIILTHDLGFFREFRRCIGSDHVDWRFVHMQGTAAEKIKVETDKSNTEKARDYLEGHDLEEASLFLRKAAEDMARRYREWAEGNTLPPGKFFSLTENLRAARKQLLADIPAALYRRILERTPAKHRHLLIGDNDSDIGNNVDLKPSEKGILKAKRRDLRRVLTDDGWTKMEAIQTLDRILKMTERVLNPATHGNDLPLYEAEVRRAQKLMDRLEAILTHPS